MLWGFDYAEIDQFPFPGAEAFVDFPKSLGLAELAKEYGDEQVPEPEAVYVELTLVAVNILFKQRTWHHLMNLAEDAGYWS